MRVAGSRASLRPRTTGYQFLPSSGGQTSDHARFVADVVHGLSQTQKAIAPRHFYDDIGSQLFQRIMDLPEYYLTACEHEIISARAADILAFSGGRPLTLVDLGAGDGRKTRHLLDALLRSHTRFDYVPIDGSEGAMIALTQALATDSPDVPVAGLVGDYQDGLRWLSEHDDAQTKLALFLGSNIGNFDPRAARVFLSELVRCLRAGDHVLIGFDLCKSPDVLLPAYDDASGVTAAFNLNLLERMNRELGATFQPDGFRHHPIYNPRTRAMESYLVSVERQQVAFAGLGLEFHFGEWEAIHTESSHKYTRADIDALAHQAGLSPVAHFSDRRGYFIDALFRVDAAA